MLILAADDEPLALELLTDSIREAIRAEMPEAEISAFSKPSKLMAFAAENHCDIAFLDINMRGMTGIELAQRLKATNPNLNIIFVTGYNEYAGDAMAMHASGYITKPVTADKIRAELADLRHPIEAAPSKKLLTVKCFGNFEVYTPDGSILHFERSKGKEALAYLVYRAGASCTAKELSAALFEDAEYDKNQRGYIQKIINSTIATLRRENAEAVIRKSFNSIALDTSMVDCDYYKFSDNDTDALNAYSGEFMAQYSWAEFVTGYLEEQFRKKNND